MNRRQRRAQAATWRDRKIPDWVPLNMREAFIRGAEYGERGEMPPEYLQTATMTEAVLATWLETSPNRPRPQFRLPGGRGLPVAVSIRDIGHRLAINEEAHELVEIWCAMKEEFKLNDHPTLEMVRAALDRRAVPYVTCGFSDIGLGPSGGYQ